MSGISKYKYQSSKFDSEDELKRLNIKRLIHLQDLQLKNHAKIIKKVYKK